MAKKSNVHPDYYKTAGREPPGQSTVHEDHKRKFASASKAQAARPSRSSRRRPKQAGRPSDRPALPSA